MTVSKFRAASSLCRLPLDQAKLVEDTRHEAAEKSQGEKNVDSESEDEEVTISCHRGLRADTEFDSSSDDDDDDDFYESTTSEHEGVVLFVSKPVPGSDSPVVKPKATPASVLSPLFDGIDNQGVSSESSEVFPFSLRARYGGTDDDKSEGEDEYVNSSSSLVACDEQSNVSKVVSDCSDESHTEETGADCFAPDDGGGDDDDLSGFLEAWSQSSVPVAAQDGVEMSDRIIGVIEDREGVLTIPNAKRVHSCNTLAELSEEAELKTFSPKRCRKPEISIDEDEICSTLKSELFDYNDAVYKENDWKDELFDYGDSYEDELFKERAPIPLLTPPSLLLGFELDGDVAAVCEWPSNLVADSAMAAVDKLHPMSPACFEDLEFRDTALTEVEC